jgi:hypothetical protein
MHFHAYICRYESVPNATDLRMCLQLQDKECHIHLFSAVVFTVRSNAVLCFLVNPNDIPIN